jgi:sulfur carrier protein
MVSTDMTDLSSSSASCDPVNSCVFGPRSLAVAARKTARGRYAVIMPRITVNAEPREYPDPLTVAELLRALRADPKRVAVELNGEVAPREEHPARWLTDGDRVEIVGPVGGG